jgi:hypothetical protein
LNNFVKKNSTKSKEKIFKKIQARKLIENAWLMYFTICEVNIKWWNKSTVDWTFEIIVPYGQIWLNLLMHDCHCGYIFFQEMLELHSSSEKQIATCDLLYGGFPSIFECISLSPKLSSLQLSLFATCLCLIL